MALNQCEKEFFEKLKRETKNQKPIETITLAEFKGSAADCFWGRQKVLLIWV